ncbi:MAG: ABC transporter ATP-binding protein [Polyangiaceae bacterium]
MSNPTSQVFGAETISRTFVEGAQQRRVLTNVSLAIDTGELVAITGASGSGKTTLLSILGLLDRDYEGTLRVFGKNVRELSERELGRLRNERIGFVFQAFHLIADATVLDNVLTPALFADRDRIQRRDAEEALERVGLRDRAESLPRYLSGGQRQRVAFARAWAQKTDVLLCDEPTGNLDSKSGREILDLLKSFHSEGKTIVVVTHSESLASAATRRISLRDGCIGSSE